MVSFTYTTIALLAAATSLQGVQASAVGTAVKNVVGAVGSILKVRGETDIWERDDTLQSEFSTCMSSLHQSRPKMVWGSDNSLEISGLPQICIAEINTYNQQPNIAAMNALQGTAKVLNSTSVHLSGLTPSFISWMKDEGSN